MDKNFTKPLFLFLFSLLISISAFAQLPSSNPMVCATAGGDGTTNINGSINTYFPPVANVMLTAGSKSISLSAVPSVDAYGNSFGSIPIKSGDLLLIIQTQDAVINYTNTTFYGGNSSTGGADQLGATGFTNLGSSGKFEYIMATNDIALTGGVLQFTGSGTGGGTVYTYTNADATSTQGKQSFQVIRIPQYANLRLTSNVSPPPFNGKAGGIIAFEVSGNMDFNGFTIDVSARGFRGGYSLIKNAVTNISDLYVTIATDDRASGKGEGIAGTPRYMWDGFNEVDNIIEGLPGGSAGRGAPANAGGGGNDTNAGGGGGGNGDSGGVGAWGYEPFGGSFPSGGRPGSKSYAGNAPNDATRLIMGGGGGGGHANDALTGVKGGVGGGIVIINSRTISGSGTILANGADGAPGVYGSHPDGSGGGGAGGSVFLKVSNPSATANITVQAKGGKGGNTEGDSQGTVQPHGPGGGAGGGIIFYNVPSGQFHSNVTGGDPGKTNSGNGITHHAEGGLSGKVIPLDVNALPPYLKGNNSICFPLLTTTLSIVDAATPKTVNGTATYIVKIVNDPSAGSAAGVQADCLLPTGFSFKSATATFSGAATGPATITNTGTAVRPLMGDFIVPAGASVTINLIVDIGCVASGTYNSSAQAVYFDPTRDYTSPNRRITPKTDAFAGSNTSYQTTSFGIVGGANYSGNNSPAEDAKVINAAIGGNIIGQTTPDAAFCISGDPTVIIGNIPTGGSGTYTYQWQSSTDNVTFTNIIGATLKDYDPPLINVITYYKRAVVASSCATPILSNTVTITVQPALANNKITAPVISVLCSAGNPLAITGTQPSGGDGNYTYAWQTSADNINFSNITGANGINYDPGVINVTTYFRRVVTSAICTTPLMSNVVSIAVQPVLANNVIAGPLNATFCFTGDAAAITGSTPTGGDGTYVYQWQKSTDNSTFTDIVGAAAKDYNPVATNVTTYYRREITSGACTLPLLSNVVTVIVEPGLAANAITAPSTNVFCNSAANPAAITGSAPTGGNGSYSYQWQSSTDGNIFLDVAGAQSQNYAPAVVNVTTYYRRTVTSDVCSVPAISNVVVITIQTYTAINNNVITPPSSDIVCKNTAPAIVTGSTPTGGAGSYTYQWQSSTDNITFTNIAGATTINYDPPAIANDTYYKRVVSSGQCVTPLVSNVVEIKTQPLPGNNIIAAPAVTVYCGLADGDLITGSTPSGGNGVYLYQWQSSVDNVTFTDITGGATSKDFDPPSITVTTYYRRTITSGSCTTPLVSNVITITVQPNITNNIITIPAVSSFCVTADAATITGNVPTGGNGVYSYQWQTSADNSNYKDVVGANAKDYDPPVKNATSYYRRMVTSGTCNVPIQSNTVTITVLAPPLTPVLVDAAPSVCPGNKATLQISSPQTGISYNWYSAADKTGLLFTGISYTTDNLTTAKTYYVEASNITCGSMLATVQVNIVAAPIAPVLVKNAIEVCTGTSATPEIANPQNGFIYNWYTNVAGGTPVHVGVSFTTPAISTVTTYYAEGVNAGGCISGTRTAVTITPIALPLVTVADVDICPGTAATLTAIGTNTGDQVLWYSSATSATPLQSGLSKTFITQPLTTATDFYVEVINSNNCKTPARFKVSVNMLQQLDAPVVTVDHTTTSSIIFKWDEVTGAKGYQVSVDGGQTFAEPSSGSDGLTHSITGLQIDQKITILVQAVGVSDCQLSGSSTAVTGSAISEFNQVFVANAFTPNGDGNNDIVYVHGERIKTLSFYVYDQWGELLFTSTDVKKGWDGYYKGTREPVGVYVYYLKAIMNDGAQLNKKGTITLLR